MRYFNIKQKANWLYLLPVAITLIFTFSLSFSSPVLAESYVGYEDGKCSSGTLRGNPTSGYTCVRGSGSGSSYTTADITCPAGSSLKKESKTETWTEPGQGLRSSTYEISRCAKDGSGDSGGSSDAQATCPPNFISQQGANGGWYCINENNPDQVSEVSDLTCPDGSEKKETEDSSIGVTTYSCASPEEEEEEKTCGSELEGIGWILCPVLNAATTVADGFWTIFEQLLVMNPLKNDSSYAPFKTWGFFRDVANALLAVIFLVVIFSQISNIGISNYGVKKMLPRLIMAAVLVNVSYFIMQITVDVANILGANIINIITGSLDFDPKTISFSELFTDLLKYGLTASVAGAALGTAAVVALSTVGTGPILIFAALLLLPALVGFIAGFLAIVFRTGVIPVLAAISPLAITAWVLPNTQSLFDKWRKLFTSMVFLYPMAALYYGSLKLVAVSMITNQDSGTFERLMGFVMLLLGTVVVFIMALKANSIVGGAMRAVSGALSKVTKPLTNAASSYAGALAGARFNASKSAFINQDHSKGQHTKYGKFSPNRQLSRAKHFIGRRMQASDQALRDAKVQEGLQKMNTEQRYNEGLAADPSRLGAVANTAGGQAYINKLVKEAATNRLDFELKGDLKLALNDSNIHVQALAAERLGGKGEWGATVARDYLSNGGKITSVNMADAFSSMKSIDAGVSAAGTAAMQRMQDPTNPVQEVSYTKEAMADFSKEIHKLSDEAIVKQSASSIAAGDLPAKRLETILSNDKLEVQLTPAAREIMEEIATDPNRTQKKPPTTGSK